VCSPFKQPGFRRRRGGKETRQRANAQQCVRSLRTPVAQILPSLADQTRRWPFSHTSRQIAKNTAASREIVPIRSRREGPSPLPEMREKTTGNDGGGLPGEGRNWGKIRPAGTISREGMRHLDLRFLEWERPATPLSSVELCLQMCDNIQSISMRRNISQDDQKKQAKSPAGGTAATEAGSLYHHHWAADKRPG